MSVRSIFKSLFLILLGSQFVLAQSNPPKVAMDPAIGSYCDVAVPVVLSTQSGNLFTCPNGAYDVSATGLTGPPGPSGSPGATGPTGPPPPGGLPISGALAIYNFTDANGAQLPDSSGNARNGTITGSPAVGVGMTFSGATPQYVTLPGAVTTAQTVMLYADLSAQYAVTSPAVVPLFGNTSSSGLRFTVGEGAELASGAVVTQSGRIATESGLTLQSVSTDHAFYRPSCYAAVFQPAANADDLYINGAHISRYYVGVGIAASTGSAAAAHGIFTLMGDPTFGYTAGTAYWAAMYSTQLTAAQIAQNCQYASNLLVARGVNLNPASTLTGNLALFEGDSITAQINLVSPYSAFVAPTTESYTVKSISIGGAQCGDDLYADLGKADSQLRPLAASNIFSLFCGTNDLFYNAASGPNTPKTPAQVWQLAAAILNARKAAGYKTMVSTMLSRLSTGSNGASMDSLKNAYNAIIRSQYKGVADVLVDLAADPNLGADGAFGNITYFQPDQVHTTTYTNQNLIGPYMSHAIDMLNAAQTVTVTNTPYTAGFADSLIRCSATTGTASITLPNAIAATDKQYVIKNVSPFGCILNAAAGQTIDGVPAQRIAPFGSLHIRDTGTNWEILDSTPGLTYLHSRSITVNHTLVSTTQTNFPVLITGTYSFLAGTANGGASQNPNGYDIIFAGDSTCSSKLNFERVSYVASTGAIEAWVSVPSLSSAANTVFYVCYGSPTVSTDPQSGPAVWTAANYSAVYHLGNGTTLSLSDSSANGYNLGATGTIVAATGKISAAAQFNASAYADLVYVPNLPLAAAQRTVSMWTRQPAAMISGQMFGYGTISANTYFAVGTSTSTNSYFVSNGTAIQLYPAAGAIDTIWHYIVAGFPSGGVNTSDNLGWIDGVSQTMSLYNSTNGAVATGSTLIVLGCSVSLAQCSNATLDEVRVRNIASTTGWILTEYNNQSAPGSFYTISSQN